MNYNVYKDPFKPRIGQNALFFLDTCFKEKIAAEWTKQENESVQRSSRNRYQIFINKPDVANQSCLDKIRERIMEKERSKVSLFHKVLAMLTILITGI